MWTPEDTGRMKMASLDPASLGLRPEQLAFEAEDGSYGVALTHLHGPIYEVREHGYATDAHGPELVAVFVALLDAVERCAPGQRIHLCSDYSDYRGSSNATRKAMLRHVVLRPSMGAVAFWGASFVTRSVAMLLNVALPRLAARPFRSREQALAFLEEQRRAEGLDGGSFAAASTEAISLDAAVKASFLLRNSDAVGEEQFGGVSRRVVRPEGWTRSVADGQGTIRLALVDEDVLLLQPEGERGCADLEACAVLVAQALNDLGRLSLSLVLDLRGVPPLGPETARVQLASLRAHAASLRHVVVVTPPGRHAQLDLLLVMGSVPLPQRPEVRDLDEAFVLLDQAREDLLHLEDEVKLPEDRAELEALAQQLHTSLRDQRKALDRLFAFVGRVSWDETYLDDSLVLPEDINEANPYWSLYGALHMMQLDMLEVLREREARNRELARAREAAEAANRAKSQFLGTVSHELRTPLNAIFGMAALLRGGGLEGDQLRQLDGIDSASRQLARLVDDLLDITRIEEGVLALREQPFDLADALESVCVHWGARARDKGLVLHRDLVRGLPSQVQGDRDRLVQVLSNLLDNAIKFTEQGWVRLAVRVLSDGRVRFEVADTGPGIPGEDLPFVFDRFERGAASRRGALPGVGLGLAICQQLVSLMGGDLEVESELCVGTRFHFALALAPAPALPLAAAPPAPEPSPEPVDFSDLLVLLVEDHAPSRYVAQRLLESLGCQVVTAEDGRQALQRLETGCYDLVLMDCQMPYYDGVEVTQRFRAAEPAGRHTPIVALTAYAFDEDRTRMLEAGMDDHVAKPVSRSRFEELLRRWAVPT